eukprot:5965519-Amphidinium_carterae.1
MRCTARHQTYECRICEFISHPRIAKSASHLVHFGTIWYPSVLTLNTPHVEGFAKRYDSGRGNREARITQPPPPSVVHPVGLRHNWRWAL